MMWLDKKPTVDDIMTKRSQDGLQYSEVERRMESLETNLFQTVAIQEKWDEISIYCCDSLELRISGDPVGKCKNA